VYADNEKITQVVSNLVNNAFKFTKIEGGEGTILIRIDKSKGRKSIINPQIVVSIKDTCRGIDSEIGPRLFTKFATKSANGIGTRLDLCISKSIVETPGDSIWG
jgi:signal transduction histidine kinase